MPDEIEMCDEHIKKGHCALHRLLWEHHDNDRREHRTDLGNKIVQLTNSITAMVPRWVFVITTASGFAFSIILFGWVVTLVTNGQTTLSSGLKDVSEIVHNIEKKQVNIYDKIDTFDDEIKKMNERQNVLRDAHLKIVQGQKGNVGP